ncbi:MAG: GAF domain-containing protein [Deltaproteobacteria bacterium]|jgi:signal transduction protein with GAF and PtsI domain|nr:GAF domain-containing protein [Deltaproteobacteria bacterium]
MTKHTINYDTIIKLTNAISHCQDPEKAALITAENVTKAFDAKGCSVFLVNRKTREMGLVASYGLSSEYLEKGKVCFMQPVKEAKDAVPIAIYDVMDDPRIQYPEEAKKEGISSLLGVPIISHNEIIGALRIYTEQPWEFSLNDISMLQAIALICGMAMEMSWMLKDHQDDLETCKMDNEEENTFGLGRIKNMNQLLRSIRGLKIKDIK